LGFPIQAITRTIVLAAARALGCEVVLTEDLAHGEDYAGVRVENPFLP